MAAVEKNTLYCSFCGKSQHEVKKLIAGPSVFICEECTILCLDILVEENFHDVKDVTREQQVLMREKRLNELVELIEPIIAAEEARSRPYALLKKRVREFKLLRGSPEKVEPAQE